MSDAKTSAPQSDNLPRGVDVRRAAAWAVVMRTAGLVLVGWLLLSVPAALVVGTVLRRRGTPPARTAAERHRLRQRCRRWATSTAAGVVALFALQGIAQAAPGTPLWSARLRVEDLRVAIELVPEQRVMLNLRFATERATELQAMASAGSLDDAPTVAADLNDHLAKAQAGLQRVSGRGGGTSSVSTQGVFAIQTQVRVLSQLVTTSCEAAANGSCPDIQLALTTSTTMLTALAPAEAPAATTLTTAAAPPAVPAPLTAPTAPLTSASAPAPPPAARPAVSAPASAIPPAAPSRPPSSVGAGAPSAAASAQVSGPTPASVPPSGPIAATQPAVPTIPSTGPTVATTITPPTTASGSPQAVTPTPTPTPTTSPSPTPVPTGSPAPTVPAAPSVPSATSTGG